MVLKKDEEERNDTIVELSEDLLSIINVFVARNNGLSASKNRKKIKKTRRRRRNKRTPKKKNLKVRKIQLSPNQKEKETLRRWIGTSRDL